METPRRDRCRGGTAHPSGMEGFKIPPRCSGDPSFIRHPAGCCWGGAARLEAPCPQGTYILIVLFTTYIQATVTRSDWAAVSCASSFLLIPESSLAWTRSLSFQLPLTLLFRNCINLVCQRLPNDRSVGLEGCLWTQICRPMPWEGQALNRAGQPYP